MGAWIKTRGRSSVENLTQPSFQIKPSIKLIWRGPVTFSSCFLDKNMLKTATTTLRVTPRSPARLSAKLVQGRRYGVSGMSSDSLRELQTSAPRPRWSRKGGRVIVSTSTAQSVRLSRSLASSAFSFLPSSQPSQEMASLSPPQSPPRWNHSPKEVLDLAAKAIDHAKDVLDKVGALSAQDCTFESVCLALLYIEFSERSLSICQGLRRAIQIRGWPAPPRANYVLPERFDLQRTTWCIESGGSTSARFWSWIRNAHGRVHRKEKCCC